jgi:hypothetical protein
MSQVIQFGTLIHQDILIQMETPRRCTSVVAQTLTFLSLGLYSSCAPGILDIAAQSENYASQVITKPHGQPTLFDSVPIQFKTSSDAEFCASSSLSPTSCTAWSSVGAGEVTTIWGSLLPPGVENTQWTSSVFLHQRNPKSVFAPPPIGPFEVVRARPTPLASPHPSDSTNATCGSQGEWDDFTVTPFSDDQTIVIGGRRNSGVATADIWLVERDALGIKRTQVLSLSNARFGHTATRLPGQNKILVTGGRFNSTTDSLTTAEVINFPTNIQGKIEIAGWSKSGNFAFFPTGHQRRFHTATLLPNGKLVLAGGHKGTSPVSNLGLQILDLNGLTLPPATALNFVSVASFIARTKHRAIAIPGTDSILFVGGGPEASIDSDAMFYAQLMDFGTEPGVTWSAAGAAGYPRGDRLIAQLLPNGKVLVAGGQDGSSAAPVSRFESVLIDLSTVPPSIDARPARRLNQARKNTAWTLIEFFSRPFVLIHGGYTHGIGLGGDRINFELYDIEADRFIPEDFTGGTLVSAAVRPNAGVANAARGRDGHQIIAYPDGAFALLGCKGSAAASDFAVEYFPAP